MEYDIEICPKAVSTSVAAAVSSRRRGLSERLGLQVRATEMRRSLESKGELEAKLKAGQAEMEGLQKEFGLAQMELGKACGLFRGVFRTVTFWGKVSARGLYSVSARSAAAWPWLALTVQNCVACMHASLGRPRHYP
jgi:hypothetical protein